MSVNIYPAFLTGKQVEHADNWSEESTLNLANGNFHSMVETMGISRLAVAPGSMKVKDMEMALVTSPKTHYTERLKALCVIARTKRAPLIAFS
jgi:hypothetical protein